MSDFNEIDFKIYKDNLLQNSYKNFRGKRNPYNNRIITSFEEYKNYLLECDAKDYKDYKGRINLYTGKTINSFFKFQQYKEDRLREIFKNNLFFEIKNKSIYEQNTQDIIEKPIPYNNKSIDVDQSININRQNNNFQKYNSDNSFLSSTDKLSEGSNYNDTIFINTEHINEKYQFKLRSYLFSVIQIFGLGLLACWWILLLLIWGLISLLSQLSLKIDYSNMSLIIIFSTFFFISCCIAYYRDKESFLENKITNLGNDIKEMEAKYKQSIATNKATYIKKEELLKSKSQEINETKAYVEKIINESSQSYPWLSNIYSELFYSIDKEIAKDLRNKKRPAIKASDSVARVAKEKKLILANNKMLEHQILYWETIFPWLEEFKEVNPYDAYDNIIASENEQDHTNDYSLLKKWLSPEEYNKLSNTEKFQLALDRYQNRNKSDWDIGIEFERYIGYQYEIKGYSVKYYGAIMGLEDMGRDLIVDTGSESLIIQCKRWSKSKTLHEKHIFQLYGSIVTESIQNPNKKYRGIFITTTILSELAKKCAKTLGIDVIENAKFEGYPLIKCNISKNGEKIYHLPFDQQYDRVQITPSTGEFYAYTVKEAENKGFRRAYRWNPHN